MDREAARRKWETLRNMTTARGCTAAEAMTAARLAANLAAKWGFAGAAPSTPRSDDDFRYPRAEQREAQRWRWEYRRCGKPGCRCSSGHPHGPYKYAKKREGQSVRSIYLGRS